MSRFFNSVLRVGVGHFFLEKLRVFLVADLATRYFVGTVVKDLHKLTAVVHLDVLWISSSWVPKHPCLTLPSTTLFLHNLQI